MKAELVDGKLYYKYVYETFTQPTMVWNGRVADPTQMAVGVSFSGTNWTRNGGTPYRAFWPNGETMGFYCDEYYGYMEVYIYVPKPLRLSGMFIQSIYEHDSCGGVYNPRMWGGNTWGAQTEALFYYSGLIIGEGSSATLPSNTSNYYQYFRLYMGNGGRSYNDRMIVKNLRLYGTTRELTFGTPDNYDYYKDTFTSKIIYNDNTYKAINSYEQGQYFN